MRTELSDSFAGAVADASSALVAAVRNGQLLMRIDFDTSSGDQTYTTLKNSIEFCRGVSSAWAAELDGDTLCLFFPDAGAAALAASQWKMGTDESLVPNNVRVAGFPRDRLAQDDAAVLIVCPRASEATATEKLIDTASTELKPIAVLNPELVDMGTTGYGLSGRLLKQRLLDNLLTVYCLKTLEWGVLVKTYPALYSVYQDDPAVPGGYTYLKSMSAMPNGEVLEEIYLEFNPPDPADDASSNSPFSQAIKGFGSFIDGFSKL